jgi:hypothetical protein
MYCPVCFQNTLKLRSNGVVKMSFNGKSRNNSLFTYNLNKDKEAELLQRLREKVVEFMLWYNSFQNKPPVKSVEIFSSDCQCSNNCKIDLVNTRVSLIGVMYTFKELQTIMQEEGARHGIEVALTPP